MLEKSFAPHHIGIAILKEPLIERGNVAKGAIILNCVDDLVQRLPDLRRFFILVERRGWSGLAHSIAADVKLVEDVSTLAVSRKCFPNAVHLCLSNADFVDTDCFRPLGLAPEHDVISIACWSRRKRIELLIRAAARLPKLRFVHLGSFTGGGTRAELAYRDACLRLAEKTGASITFPFGHCDKNEDLPWDKTTMNAWLNKARLGVLTATQEGHNRFKMECMAADRPVLLAADAGPTTQKHLHPLAGALFQPDADALARAITHALEHLPSFRPRKHLLACSGRARSVLQLRQALGEACARSLQPYRFEGVDWDGRNERFTWGEPAFARLTELLRSYRARLSARPVRVVAPRALAQDTAV